ncbi:MAG: hypothetical protein RL217_734 [Pseudomonadota bacterium]|jgi:GGDEF domain-containing protein
MKKTEFHGLLMSQVKIIYALLAALGLSVIAGLDLYEKHYHFAAVAAGFALGLVFYAMFLLLTRKRPTPYPYVEWLLVLLLLFFTLFGMHQSAQVVHWVYFVPVYTFFLLPFIWANVALLFYSVLLTWVIWRQFEHDSRLQVIFTYLACFLFSFMYALINEMNNKRLLKLTNTDPLTQAFNENQLVNDLNKEITRAERQRSSLLLIWAAVPQSWSVLALEEFEQNLGRLGFSLRKSLRKFDTCYRLENNSFVIVMPQGEVADVVAIQQELQPQLVRFFKGHRDFRFRTLAYRPGDDALGLLRRLQEK